MRRCIPGHENNPPRVHTKRQAIKAVLGGNTYAYIGEWYEVGPTTRKYYTIGGARVAMRDSGLGSNPYYLINDHLGSHALTANNAGLLQAEVRYKAWGDDRYTSGTMPTAYRYTGQRWDTWSGTVGLYFYNARYYEACVARARFLRFASLSTGCSRDPLDACAIMRGRWRSSSATTTWIVTASPLCSP